jgi:hypothetical protein
MLKDDQAREAIRRWWELTPCEIHEIARKLRRQLPKSFAVPRQMEAWQRTINREVSREADALARWRSGRGVETTGPKSIALVYDIALITALALTYLDDYARHVAILDGQRPEMTMKQHRAATLANIRRHYMDGLAPYFAERKREYEGQKQLEKNWREIPPGLRPQAPLASAGEFQYLDGRLVYGDGPYRPVSDDQIVYMRGLIEKYGRRPGRPRVKNPSAATLRKRRQRERERESVTNSCVKSIGGKMLATDEQLAHDAEQLAELAREIFSIALRWQARFPNSRILADTVDTFIREALAAS